MYRLNIKILDESVREYYTNFKKSHPTDSGVDTVVPKEYVIPAKSFGNKIGLGIAGEPLFKNDEVRGYEVRPRSSTAKTPIRLGNGFGTIDYHYRGEICAIFDNISDKDYTIVAGTKLWQICNADLSLFDIKVVDELSATDRGAGGFGSTGLVVELNKLNLDKDVKIEEIKEKTIEPRSILIRGKEFCKGCHGEMAPSPSTHEFVCQACGTTNCSFVACQGRMVFSSLVNAPVCEKCGEQDPIKLTWSTERS